MEAFLSAPISSGREGLLVQAHWQGRWHNVQTDPTLAAVVPETSLPSLSEPAQIKSEINRHRSDTWRD